MDDLSSFCCLNPACTDLGKRGHGNLTVTARYGPGKTRRMLRCRTCKARFAYLTWSTATWSFALPAIVSKVCRSA
jgi:hypothetical protein